MKIKVAILEHDENYLNRIVSSFNMKYNDKIEIYSFTNKEIALETIKSNRIDVFLANFVFDIDFTSLNKNLAFAYLVDSMDVDTVKQQRAICKYQKADLIYKQILSIYSEKAEFTSGIKSGDDSAKVIAFCSVGCGAGASTLAASAAVHFAKKHEKTLYLNLEKLGSADVFFKGEGKYSMRDIIYAIKSRKANLYLKLESSVKQDESGVYFYSQSKLALDMCEISIEEIVRLISELKHMGSYEYIVLDFDFNLNKEVLKVYSLVNSVVWVGDGSVMSNNKIMRAFEAVSIMEKELDIPILSRVKLAYNKFSSKTGFKLEAINLPCVGGVPVYVHSDIQQVIEQISVMDLFDKIIQ